jgi:hypothetical protein
MDLPVGSGAMRFYITYGVWRNLRIFYCFTWLALPYLSGKTSFVTTIICYSNSFNYAVNGVTIFSASAKLLKEQHPHHH